MHIKYNSSVRIENATAKKNEKINFNVIDKTKDSNATAISEHINKIINHLITKDFIRK